MTIEKENQSALKVQELEETTIEQQVVSQQKLKSKGNLKTEVMGKWPGDETDEEVFNYFKHERELCR